MANKPAKAPAPAAAKPAPKANVSKKSKNYFGNKPLPTKGK